MHSTGTGQPVETQDVFFWRLAGADRISNCPLDRVLTYKNLIYLLNLQFHGFENNFLRLWGTGISDVIFDS